VNSPHANVEVKQTAMIPIVKDAEARRWLTETAALVHDDSNEQVEQRVSDIIQRIKNGGDAEVATIAAELSDNPPRKFVLDDDELARIKASLSKETIETITKAAERITAFNEAIMASILPVSVQHEGFETGFQLKPVARAACYVPAGRYPLPSTALMTAITASVAGVEQVCIFSPKLSNEIIFAGAVAGVFEFYEIGGAQAIAVAAYGTETIEPFDVIVGPGNAYVTEAKRQIQGVARIDMLAGPSEVCIIADKQANPEWTALDLLAQAEHDPDARCYLFTDDEALATRVQNSISAKVIELRLPDFLNESLAVSVISVFPSIDDCINAANVIAPEHLQLAVADPKAIKDRLTNYGALFGGTASTVPYGDYVAGPNHTLPTNRSARHSGGLSPFTFLRPQTWLHVPAPSATLANESAAFARIEGLRAHEAASIARLR
jgi:histidinol dehydrogenase